MKEFAAQQGLVFISDFNLERTRAFRESWTNRGLAAQKKLEALRTFFTFDLDNGWVKENPAKKIKAPKTEDPPVMPFSDDEMAAILKATLTYPDKRNSIRLRALVLLLRYSGLRITDAVTLSRDRIKDGKLMLRTAKTGTVVHLPLPPEVIRALDACQGETYPFWTGKSTVKSAAAIWQRTLHKLFGLSGVEGAHAHRFRHSFAVSLLLKGVPIESVATLLGHESVKTTIKHYSAWSLARQEQLEREVKKTWQAGRKLFGTVTHTARQNSGRKKQQKSQ